MLERLGAGGMGVVLAAHDSELDRKVAIKVLRPDAPAQGELESGQQILLREAQALARLSHPNVITVYDVGVVDEHVFLAMEYVDGTTLGAWLGNGGHDWREILGTFIAAGRGLAAAHRAGLVHRDFKPSNVLIGKDGRVQVTDFGVAKAVGALAAAAGTPESSAEPGGTSLLELTMGATGDAVGTLRFMAPEQHTRGPIDPRTDQFAFCVALHLALYGEHPFDDAELGELRRSVCAGGVRALSKPTAVPSAVRSVLLRGLRPEPGTRYPSTDDLLAELEPLAAPPWRRHRLAATLLLIAVASLLSVLAVSAWRRHTERLARQAREDVAVTSLRALRDRVEPLLDQGRAAEVDAAFEAFLQIDDYRGTNAVAQAWLQRAEWMRRQGRHDDELAAWAAAWAHSPRQETQAQALLGLAHAFRRRWEWDRLNTVLDRLERDFGRGPAHDPELASLRVTELLARRDLLGAVALLGHVVPARDPAGYDPVGAAPVLAALAHATPTSIDARSVTVTSFRGAPAIFVLESGGRTVQLLRADASLAPLWKARLPDHLTAEVAFPLPVAADRFFVLVQSYTGTGTAAVPYRLEAEQLVPAHEWHDLNVLTADTFDVDRDGQVDIVIGTGPYTRRLLQLDETTAGWRFLEPSDLAGPGSDVLAVQDADLDGDGDNEVLMSLGPWQHFEVRVARRTRHGLVTAARQKLGVVNSLAVLHTKAGVRIAAAKSNDAPSRLAFPDGEHYGEPAGIILLRWDGTDLVRDGGIAIPPLEGRTQISLPPLGSPLVVADLDGDGLEDLVTTVDAPARHHVLLARQREDGSLAAVLVGNLEALAAVELDGDPGAELLVRLASSSRLWVLGLGADALPAVTPAPTGQPAPVPSVATDPLLSRMWARAEDLAAMGLADEAAQVIDRIAALGGPLRDRARLRAAALREQMGDLAGAADRFEAAAAYDLDAGLRAAELRARYYDFEAAQRLAGAVAERPDASQAQRAAARALLERIAPMVAAPRLDYSFAGPMAPAWRIRAPEAVRRDLATSTLLVEAFPSDRSLLEVPVTRVGDWLHVSVDVDLEHTDLGSGLEVALVDPTVPGSHLGVVVQARGGGLILWRYRGCSLPQQDLPAASHYEGLQSPDDRARVTLALDYVASENAAWCSVTDGTGHVLLRRRMVVTGPPPAGPLLLVVQHGRALRPSDEAASFTQRASVRIHRIEVRGLREEATPMTPLQRAHHQLVDGDAAGALASYDAARAEADPSWSVGRAVALTSLGRDAQAVDELRRSLAQLDVGRAVWQLVLVQHTPFAEALLDALGPRAVVGVSWWMALHGHLDDPHVRGLVAQLPDASIEAVVTSASRPNIVIALCLRGTARWRSGQVAAARADLERAVLLAGPLLAARAATDEVSRLVPGDVALAHAQLAAICSAQGDERTALAHAAAAVAIGWFPDFIRHSLGAEPTLAPHRGQPGWQDILPR